MNTSRERTISTNQLKTAIGKDRSELLSAYPKASEKIVELKLKNIFLIGKLKLVKLQLVGLIACNSYYLLKRCKS